jgi:hypothetical protein
VASTLRSLRNGAVGFIDWLGPLMLLHKKRGRALAVRKAPLITGHPATLQKEQIHPCSDAKADPAQLEQPLFIRDFAVMRIALMALLICIASIAPVSATDSNLKSEEIYSAWLKMYDLRFAEAHRTLERWQEAHPNDSLGPVSDAAGYLYSELTRLGVLESQLFVDDNRFKNRKTLDPDTQVKASFIERIGQADRLADLALQKSGDDPRALFVKTLAGGLRADYAALVEGHGVKALSYAKAARVYANRLLAVDPQAFDAYLAPGVENYLLSLKPVAVRLLLRLTGSETDREKGLEDLRKTADEGYYLEPFAKLLLVVAALRDDQKQKARQILTELHNRFPENQLYAVELDHLGATDQ